MATLHLYAVGRITGGAVDILLAPRRQQPVCSDSHGCRCYAYSHGYDDAKAGYLPEPLHHVSAVCCIERYMAGFRDACTVKDAAQMPLPASKTEWHTAPLTKHAHIEYLCSLTQDEEPADGELHRLIDEAEQTAEHADWLEDVEWMRRGC